MGLNNHKSVSLTPSFSRLQTYLHSHGTLRQRHRSGLRSVDVPNIAAVRASTAELTRTDDGGLSTTDSPTTLLSGHTSFDFKVDADVGDFVIVVRVTDHWTHLLRRSDYYYITVTREARRCPATDASLTATHGLTARRECG